MLRALLKKHFLAFATPFTQGRGGKKRSKWAALGFAVLMLYAFVAMGSLFWMTSSTLCAPLVEQGQAWLYFAFMGVVATAIGVVGGAQGASNLVIPFNGLATCDIDDITVVAP